ncbi:hypothetical protein [Paucilactobacillus nenjiangensis]|uniref:Uncharacterized protein n=1 Tax=Paucilactobacillus nenjiangensis TaxID=1296540 RepID=A0A5P1WYT6_9LACO|nr:hypothetical protein [Paucilactobacillus nenjiangensis]QER66820.1 hypothetical protein F0161_02320 [Paucilactobacillus nenjiangensis]
MKYHKFVFLYLSISTVIYYVVNIIMNLQTGTEIFSSEVMPNFGIILGFYLLSIFFSCKEMRFSAYLTIFMLIVLSFTFGGAMIVSGGSDMSLLTKVFIDVLSLAGLALNVLCFIAAGKQRANYQNPKLKGK